MRGFLKEKQNQNQNKSKQTKKNTTKPTTKPKQKKKICFEDVVHNQAKFQAGTDVNLRWRKDDKAAMGVAASSGPPHEDCFSLTR